MVPWFVCIVALVMAPAYPSLVRVNLRCPRRQPPVRGVLAGVRQLRQLTGGGIKEVTTGRTMHVLVVDDDAKLRVLLSTTFDRPDTTVEEVHDVEHARVAIARRRPDVIVLDVNLPGTDGVTFTRELKRDPATSDIGIVLLTGGTLETQAGEDAGAATVVRKPFSPLDLLAAVEAAAGTGGVPLLAEARAAA